MARYRVLEQSFVNNTLHEEGDEIDYDLPKGTTVGANLEPLDDEKPKKDA